jgi:hypothetical protein
MQGAVSQSHDVVRSLRESLDPAAAMFRDLALLGFLFLAIVVVLTFEDYGITHDEEVQRIYGELLLNYYLSGFADKQAFEYIDLFRYGGLFDMVAALLSKISPFGMYETRHLLGGLVGILGLVGVWRLGRVLGGYRAAFLAMLLLALTPSFYGHSFNNPKDAPFAGAMVWVLYYTCRIILELPKPRLSLVLKFGLSFGLAISIRVGAILAVPYIGFGVVLYLGLIWVRSRDRTLALREAWTAFKAIIPAIVLAYAVMALFWPWAVQEPLNPLHALTDFAYLPLDLDTLFEGEWVKATNLPPSYLLDYLAVKLPEIILAGLLCGVVIVVFWMVHYFKRTNFGAGSVVTPKDRRAICFAAVILAAAFPVIFFMVTTPTAYNGIRHFLFVVPPIAALSAVAIDQIWVWLQTWSRLAGRTFAAILTTVLALQVWVMVQLHPDQYVYYNQLVGGVKGAEGAFELDYWGNSLVEATNTLADFLENENGGQPPEQIYRVAVCGHRLSAAYFFPPYLEFTRAWQEADFLISFTQKNCHRYFDGDQIITISRFGAALSVVKDRRDLLAARREKAKKDAQSEVPSQ